MKRPLIIAFLLTLFNITFGQTDTLKFKQFGDSIEFSEFKLNPNKTFIFHHYNMRSCWTWYSVAGTWKTDNNKIIFTDTIHWEEDIIRLDTSINNKTDYILITVKSDNGEPLKGIKVKYGLRWGNSNNSYVTDEKGEIKISKSFISKQKQKGDDDNSVEFAIHFSNKKSSECSMSTSFEASYNRVDITIVDNPKEELIIRTTTYRIDNNNIYFETQHFTGDKGYGIQNWGNFKLTAGQITTGNKRFGKMRADE